MPSSLASHECRIEFLSYGPVVLLQLLSTPPRGDAVTFGSRPVSGWSGGTLTLLFRCAPERTGPGVPTPGPAHRSISGEQGSRRSRCTRRDHLHGKRDARGVITIRIVPSRRALRACPPAICVNRRGNPDFPSFRERPPCLPGPGKARATCRVVIWIDRSGR